MCRPRSFKLLALTSCVLLTLFGCGGHRDKPQYSTSVSPATSGTGSTTSGTGSTNTNTNTSTATLDVAATTSGAVADSKMVADVVALTVTLAATGTDPVEITEINVTAKGTIDESTALGELKIVGDDNANGALDQGEQTLTSVAAPAFPADDATITVALSNPLQIAAGASVSLLVTVDATAGPQAALALIGKTIELEISAAGDVVATSNGQAITATPTGFPISQAPTALYVHDHLLLSEIVRMPGSGEYIELFNPTAQPIDLSDVYLTDSTNLATAPTWNYHLLPTGTGFQPVDPNNDFIVRFPAGASIAPGQAITVAMDATGFQTLYGQLPDYFLRNGAGAAVAMLSDDGQNPPTWAAPGTGIRGGLTDGGEPVILFRWDGQTDLVQDLDYIFYGTESASNTRVFKDPSLTVDGPDADTNPSAYLADTDTINQTPFAGAGSPNSAIARVEYTEAGETATAGNGITGHDETSEPFDVNFMNAVPTPGAP